MLSAKYPTGDAAAKSVTSSPHSDKIFERRDDGEARPDCGLVKSVHRSRGWRQVCSQTAGTMGMVRTRKKTYGSKVQVVPCCRYIRRYSRKPCTVAHRTAHDPACSQSIWI